MVSGIGHLYARDCACARAKSIHTARLITVIMALLVVPLYIRGSPGIDLVPYVVFQSQWFNTNIHMIHSVFLLGKSQVYLPPFISEITDSAALPDMPSRS